MDDKQIVALLNDLAAYGAMGKVAEPAMVERAHEAISALEGRGEGEANDSRIPYKELLSALSPFANSGAARQIWNDDHSVMNSPVGRWFDVKDFIVALDTFQRAKEAGEHSQS